MYFLRIRVLFWFVIFTRPWMALLNLFSCKVYLLIYNFVDTGSTLPDCLNELQRLNLGCSWIRLENSEQRYGPYSIWLVDRLQCVIRSQKYPYIVTDRI